MSAVHNEETLLGLIKPFGKEVEPEAFVYAFHKSETDEAYVTSSFVKASDAKLTLNKQEESSVYDVLTLIIPVLVASPVHAP
jgi:hypothetical protein